MLVSLPQTAGASGQQINPACPSLYGVSCPTGQLFIDKKIKNPKTGELIESLSSIEATFLADQDVEFRIEVKNTGSSDLNNIQVQDKLPDFVTFVSGPGSFDTASNTLKWSIDKLKGGEFQLFTIKTKIKSQSALPTADITCVTNFTQAQQDQMQAQDNAAFCIQTGALKIAPTTQLPSTGLPPVAWILGGLLPFGLLFRRFAVVKKTDPERPFHMTQRREFSKD